MSTLLVPTHSCEFSVNIPGVAGAAGAEPLLIVILAEAELPEVPQALLLGLQYTL